MYFVRTRRFGAVTAAAASLGGGRFPPTLCNPYISSEKTILIFLARNIVFADLVVSIINEAYTCITNDSRKV